MSEQVHGHEIMRMMLEEGGSFTSESLKETIIEKFGEDTKYYACSADNMDVDQLIVFLRNKGKFIDSQDGFNTDPNRICSHE